MKINYNVTGAQRKSLVGAISQELNTPTKYLGMPTAAYEVGEYTIDKTGTVTGPDNRELVADLQGLHSFIPVSEEYGTPDAEIDNPVHLGSDTFRYRGDPNAPITEAMLRQLDEAPIPPFEDLRMTEEEELGLGRQRRDPMGEDGMQASDVPERYHYRAELSDPDSSERMEVFSADDDEDALRQAYEYATGEVVLLELQELDENYDVVRSVDIPRNRDSLIIELPRDGFTETAISNLEKLVESKAALIKKAVGAECLPIEVADDTLRFPWFRFGISPEEINAYSRFISALCKMAKEQKRITAKEKPVDNEKYAFRCFLLRLGFIGDDCKAERKILLSKLSGNGSFKSGERKQPEVSTDETQAAVETYSGAESEAAVNA